MVNFWIVLAIKRPNFQKLRNQAAVRWAGQKYSWLKLHCGFYSAGLNASVVPGLISLYESVWVSSGRYLSPQRDLPQPNGPHTHAAICMHVSWAGVPDKEPNKSVAFPLIKHQFISRHNNVSARHFQRTINKIFGELMLHLGTPFLLLWFMLAQVFVAYTN